jgi:Putative F0F1-ATPase subunit Ca2+/Mg2+ transporter
MGMSESGGGRKSDAGSWTTVLALVAQLGFSIACPMVLFIGGGAWLDNRLGWGPWFLFVGILLGVATAAGLFYQIATLPTRKRRDKDQDNPDVPYKMERPGSIKGVDRPRANKSNRNGH